MAVKKRKGRARRKRKGRTRHKIKTQAGGMANQVVDAAQDVYGQAANATRNRAVKLESRNAVEAKPSSHATAPHDREAGTYDAKSVQPIDGTPDGVLAPRQLATERAGAFDAKQNVTENAMNDSGDVGRKTTQKARETAEIGRQAAEGTVLGVEQSYSAAFDNIRNLNVKLIDTAQANANAVCALARDVVTIRTPSDLLAVWMNHAQKQFDMATKQASDLTALGQKLATESTAPITRSFQQAFTQGST